MITVAAEPSDRMTPRTSFDVLPTPAPASPAADPSPVRTVEIRSPSNRGETMAVLRASAVVACLAGAYIASSSPTHSPSSAPLGRPPYQRLFADLQPAEQRLFRELQEAILEAENIRLTAARWPTADELARSGISPFSPPPGHRTAGMQWANHRDGLVVNYLGLPTTPGLPAYLVLILEPDPATPHAAVPADEEHQRLADGTILHVTVWLRKEPHSHAAHPTAITAAERP